MALRNIKELIENKGYVIKPQDRKIFEEGDLQSFFGFSPTDSVEFIIYDVNDNQLPHLDGKLVRYINLNDENIRDYFLIPEGTLLKQFELPDEYFIDVERLLNESGYSNGIFKTQMSLVNKRAGSEREFDKLWIQEISPSRTEVRLFPLKQGIDVNSELKERFETFVRGGEFREDVIQIAFEAIEQLSPQGVTTFLKDKYGDKWINNFIKEFKIKDIESLTTQIHSSFITSVLYEFTNRFSKIGTNNYGSKKIINPPISLSKREVVNIIKRILIETIYYYLPERDINKETNIVEDFIASEDLVEDVLQKETSDISIPPKTVQITQIDVVKTNNNIQDVLVEEAKKEIKDEVVNNDEIDEKEVNTEDDEIDVKTPDNEPDISEPIEEDSEPIIDFDEFFEIIDDVVVPLPIDDKIDYNDDRVDIDTKIVIDGEEFDIIPLPNDIVGGSPVSGEGEQGSPSPGSGATSSPNAPIGNREFSNPQDAIDNEFRYRTRKTIREL